MENETLLTTEEVADMLKVEVATVRQYIKQYRESDGEKGLHALKVGRAYRIPMTSVETFLQQN